MRDERDGQPGRARWSPLCMSGHTFFSIQYPAKKRRAELLTAAVERGPSQAARSVSKKKLRTPLHRPFRPAS